MAKTNKDKKSTKPTIKIVAAGDLPPEVRDAIGDIIKDIKTKREKQKPTEPTVKERAEAFKEVQDNEPEGLECEVHIQHYERYLGVCFNQKDEKIGILHTGDKGKFKRFLKDSGNTDDGYIRKIIVYKADRAIVDTTKYSKGKKKKPKNVIVVKAPKK